MPNEPNPLSVAEGHPGDQSLLFPPSMPVSGDLSGVLLVDVVCGATDVEPIGKNGLQDSGDGCRIMFWSI